MTDLQVVYDAFLARILEDEWSEWAEEEVKQEDWRQLLNAALPWFKFPRVSLNIVSVSELNDLGVEESHEYFEGDLGVEEISIIANYMKCEWLNRCVMTWENVKPLYEERDFSQANLLDKLKNLVEEERKAALWHESLYYRSHKGKPFKYGRLAGSND